MTLAQAAQAGSAMYKPGEYGVFDAMTLTLGGKDIRLANIAAPKLGQMCMIRGKKRDCGVIARSQLLDLTAAAHLKCNNNLNGSALCLADGFDLSEQMIYTGWAVPLPGAPDRYLAQRADAETNKRGFWNAEFVEPWPAQAR